jgi:hypothetical protein
MHMCGTWICSCIRAKLARLAVFRIVLLSIAKESTWVESLRFYWIDGGYNLSCGARTLAYCRWHPMRLAHHCRSQDGFWMRYCLSKRLSTSVVRTVMLSFTPSWQIGKQNTSRFLLTITWTQDLGINDVLFSSRRTMNAIHDKSD